MLNSNYAKEVYEDLTVLIATKDRLNQITQLLTSLGNSSILPGAVIIVHSGIDIESELQKFNALFKIIIIKSHTASQVYQKQLGLSSLPVNCKWVLFLDDDVVIEPNSVELLYTKYILNPDYANYRGFGLAIKNRISRKNNKLITYLLYLVKLYSFYPGDVTKSGHPQAYLNQANACDVAWLNGLSIWSRKVIDYYFNIPFISDYAAYEDVIFSYKVSRQNKLLFASDIFVLDQIIESKKPLTLKQFVAGFYARYFFVNSNPEMSKFWLLTGQVIRNIDFIVRSRKEGNPMTRIQITSKLFFALLLSSCRKIETIESIKDS
jgi:hypothetical protein